MSPSAASRGTTPPAATRTGPPLSTPQRTAADVTTPGARRTANRALNRATRTRLHTGAASGARIRNKMSAITPPGSRLAVYRRRGGTSFPATLTAYPRESPANIISRRQWAQRNPAVGDEAKGVACGPTDGRKLKPTRNRIKERKTATS